MHPRAVAPVVAVVVTLVVGGVGAAQGSAPAPQGHAKASKSKKRHALDVDYRSGFVDVVGEGEGPSDVEFSDEATLTGRPFGRHKAELNESRFFTYNSPHEIPRMDYSGREQVSFEALVFGSSKFKGRPTGKLRGLYDYAVDSEGNPLDPITGVITSGGGTFRGAGGRFTVLGLHTTNNDPVKLAAHWKGFIRY
jgi:hypothetical protein